jgi:hypothetical protein
MVVDHARRDVYGDETHLWTLLRFAFDGGVVADGRRARLDGHDIMDDAEAVVGLVLDRQADELALPSVVIRPSSGMFPHFEDHRHMVADACDPADAHSSRPVAVGHRQPPRPLDGPSHPRRAGRPARARPVSRPVTTGPSATKDAGDRAPASATAPSPSPPRPGNGS